MCILIFQYYTLFILSLNLNKCMSECKEMNFLAKDAEQKLMVFSKIARVNATQYGESGDGLRITEKNGSISFQSPFLGCPWSVCLGIRTSFVSRVRRKVCLSCLYLRSSPWSWPLSFRELPGGGEYFRGRDLNSEYTEFETGFFYHTVQGYSA